MPAITRENYRGWWIFVAVISAVYLQNTISLPGVGAFPGPLAFATCLALFPYVVQRVDKNSIAWIAVAAGSALVFGFFSYSARDYLWRIPIGSIQLGSLLFLGYLIFLYSKLFDTAVFHRMCWIVLLALLAVCVVEINVPSIRSAMDQFRVLFYGETRAYIADMRDIVEHGGVRPKAFASEPSYLAQYGSLLFIGAFLTSVRAVNRLFFILIFVVFIFLVRSPSLVSGVAAVPLYYLMATVNLPFRRSSGVRPWELGAFWIVVFYIVAIGAILILVGNAAQLDGRIAAILEGRDSSYLQRIGVPFAIAYQVISNWPIFGVGIGGNESIDVLILNIYSAKLPNFYYFFDAVGGSLGSNAIIHWTYFGLFGGIFMLWIYHRLVVTMTGINWALWVWAFYLPFCFTVGGYSYHAWPPLFFLAAVLVQVNRLVLLQSSSRAAPSEQRAEPSAISASRPSEA